MKSMNMDKMFKKLESSHILGCLALLVLLWALMSYSNNKSTMGYSNQNKPSHAPVGVADEMPDMAANVAPSSSNKAVAPNELLPSGASAGAISLGLMLRTLTNHRDKYQLLGYDSYIQFRDQLEKKLLGQWLIAVFLICI